MAGENDHHWDLLLVVTSDRYGSALFGTVRRVIDAALRGGHSIQVWACGYSTMLTQRSLAQREPPDEVCCAADQPSAAEQIGRLVTEQAGRFSWLACQTCSDDRGAGEHIAGVPSPSLAQFRDYVDSAAKVVYIGGT